ncbi:MAG TPA: tripartite tricarboxylate transporter substrate binding protein [Xanthobacteraceae bacterium]|nr:tripartite tricarboxylate transporter substrate binding protein [Xanthobacteraceae bacterium]
MKLPRRTFMKLAASTTALWAGALWALAQNYPSRPIRLVVGFPPGGGVDIVARMMGQWLSERLGQQVIVENRPGAGGNLATEAVVRAPPDGYTLTYVGPVAAINASFYKNLSFDFIRDIAPVASFIRVPNVMAVNPAVPARTVPEFIAYARANPGKINLASSGSGTVGHVAGELFQMMTGVKLVHVPYRGETPALTDLIAGRVQVIFIPMPASIEYVKAGALRALAVTTTTRSDIMPDVASLNDFVPGYEASTWYGVGAPKNTPEEIIDMLNREINAALADPQIRSRLVALGGMVLAGSPADFGKLITDETAKWAKVVKFADIHAE